MRAALYTDRGPAADVLRVEELPVPEPGPGEVRVKVQVSGVNPTDVKARGGATPRPIHGFQIPHQDGAGVIDAVGPGVDPNRTGQAVWMWLAAATRPWGTAAEWTVVPERQAVPLPPGVSPELGACLGVPALTAHRCLFADGPVSFKEILVAGGAGAVGHFAVELAHYAGARVVATVGGDEQARLAERAGADLVVNYRDPDVTDQVQQATGSVDRIVEVDLGANLALDLAVSGPDTIVAVYANSGDDPVFPFRQSLSANVTVRFVLLYGVPDAALDQAVRDITAALRARALTELPLVRFKLDQIVDAHEAVESGTKGKVLIDLS